MVNLIEGYIDHQLAKKINDSLLSYEQKIKSGKHVGSHAGRATDIVGKKFKMSGRQIDKIRKVEREGSTNTRRLFHSKKLTINQAYKQVLKETRPALIQQDLPKGKYNVIYANIPWEKSISVDDINREFFDSGSMKSMIHRNAVIFVWVGVPEYKEHLKVLERLEDLGFKYKTQIFWIKTGITSPGEWFDNQVNIMMMYVKGKVDSFQTSLPNVIIAPVDKHSYVPVQFRNLIERATSCMGKTRKLELFARRPANGWTSWRNAQ